MELGSGIVEVGSGHRVLIARVLAVVDPAGSGFRQAEQLHPARRCWDLTNGRPTRSLLLLDNGDLVATALRARTLAARIERRMLREIVVAL